MSVIALTPYNFDYTKLETFPSRSFTSSSSGLTGSVHVYSERSSGRTSVKDMYFHAVGEEVFGESGIFSVLEYVKTLEDAGTQANDGDISSVFDQVVAYTSSIERFLPRSERFNHQISIKRDRPSPLMTTSSMAKNFMKNVLMRDYAHEMNNPNWAYTNYNCLKFFTGSKVPAQACLIYPAFTRSINLYSDSGVSLQQETRSSPGPFKSEDGDIEFANPPNYAFFGKSTNIITEAVFRANHALTYTPFIPCPKLSPLAPSDMNQRVHPSKAGYQPPPAGFKPFEEQTQFTFEFWIKPNINELDAKGEFRAGTLMHMSSTYAVSLVTGSLKDPAGRPDGFRMMLQMSHSAERPPLSMSLNAPNNSDYPTHTNPSYTGLRSKPNDLVFLSSDNSLRFNRWHHVAMRWGSDVVDGGYGDFVIDGKIDSKFLIASSTAFTSPDLPPGFASDGTKVGGTVFNRYTPGANYFCVPSQNYRQQYGTRSLGCPSIGHIRQEPNAMFIGNFYEGKNSPSDNSEIARFFNDVAAENEGVISESGLHEYAGTAKDSDPQNVTLRHPLQAEVHELRIWDEYRTLDQIVTQSSIGISSPVKAVMFQDYGVSDGASGNKWLRPLTIDSISSPNPRTSYMRNTIAPNKKVRYRPPLGVVSWPGYTKTGAPPSRRYSHFGRLLFYLPVLFTKESGPSRRMIKTIAQLGSRGTSHDPFNVELSLRQNITEINTNNFLRDFVTGYYPRQFLMTASIGFDMGRALDGATPMTFNLPEYLDGYGNTGTFYDSWGSDTTDPLVATTGLFSLGSGAASLHASHAKVALTTARASQGAQRRKASLRRNLLVMPCDNGLFRPDWAVLVSGSQHAMNVGSSLIEEDQAAILKNLAFQPDMSLTPVSGSPNDKFVNRMGHLDYSLISIDNIWKRNGTFDNANVYDQIVDKAKGVSEFQNTDPSKLSDQFKELVGATPYHVALWTHNFQRGEIGQDKVNKYLPSMVASLEGPRLLPSASSNAVSWWNISNIYYGDRIRPGTLKLRGSVGCRTILSEHTRLMSGTFPMTLRDDGRGGLYRADAKTPHAKWNNVGNVFYSEGLVLIKSPHIEDLGSSDFEGCSIDFVGDRNVHILEIMFEAPAGKFSSSSNPTFQAGLLPTDHISDQSSNFVYITGLNFHDDNFNVIARSNLAQPVVKREEDKLFFRVKIDF